jgi:hypothetical protein
MRDSRMKELAGAPHRSHLGLLAGAAALLDAVVAWFAACAGGRRCESAPEPTEFRASRLSIPIRR